MKSSRIQKKIAFGCIAAIAFFGTVFPSVHAAITTDTEKLQHAVEIHSLGSGFVELKNLPVTVNLYKVAEINKKGECEAVDLLHELDFSEVNSNMSASELEQISMLAKEKIEITNMEATASVQTENGSAFVEDLMTGLYLVDAQTALSEYYLYEFEPYLVALQEPTKDDYVIYLKSSKDDRYGNLVIEKELDAYNETIGGATFVFQIEASKTDVDTQKEEVVYSDVVSMTFQKPGIDRIVIENIPAGAEVIVTEIYSGASYKLTSDSSVTVPIVANEEGKSPAIVNFSNTYDKRLNGGTGLVNHFTYNSENNEWTYSVAKDSTQ